MKNKKIFIGNLNFEISDAELKELLLQYGTVMEIRLYRKKGYALAEFETSEEAENAVKNLSGVVFLGREIHISPALRPRRAKSVTVKKYADRGNLFAGRKKMRVTKNHEAEKSTLAGDVKIHHDQSEEAQSSRQIKSFSGKKGTGKRFSGERNISGKNPDIRTAGGKKTADVKSSPQKFSYKSKAKVSSNSFYGEKTYGKKSGFNEKKPGKYTDREEKNVSRSEKDLSRQGNDAAVSDKPVSTYKPRTAGRNSFRKKFPR
ncbi:MAG: RNA-binding protein [Spirochaetes bacterium]|nr:RNA-binding protein [Spirochaetota bacterium]